MLITFVGVAGIGLVWGWLNGRLLFWLKSLSMKELFLAVESLLLSIQIFLFSNWLSLTIFWIATASALLVHVQWLRMLKSRYSLSDLGGVVE